MPSTSPDDLLDGLRDYVAPRHLPDGRALDRYCYCVASTVVIAMAHLLWARNASAARHACDLGIAMQLTNVLRDVGEDLARGRIYVAAEDMDWSSCCATASSPSPSRRTPTRRFWPRSSHAGFDVLTQRARTGRWDVGYAFTIVSQKGGASSTAAWAVCNRETHVLKTKTDRPIP